MRNDWDWMLHESVQQFYVRGENESFETSFSCVLRVSEDWEKRKIPQKYSKILLRKNAVRCFAVGKVVVLHSGFRDDSEA